MKSTHNQSLAETFCHTHLMNLMTASKAKIFSLYVAIKAESGGKPLSGKNKT